MMDRLTRERQTDALLSALAGSGTVDGVIIAAIRGELAILRGVAEAADVYRVGVEAGALDLDARAAGLVAALDTWKGYAPPPDER